MNFTISDSTIQVYRIRSKDGFAWADITIDEGEKSGRITIASDYGDWQYYWGATGNSFKEFLCEINIGYVAGKFGEHKYFNYDSTINNMKNEIIQARKDDDLDTRTAREYYDLIKGFEYSNWSSLQYQISHSGIMDFYEGFPEGIFTISPHFQEFWDTIWKFFIQELKKEIETPIEAIEHNN